MVNRIFISLAFVFFVSLLQCQVSADKCPPGGCRGRRPYDPSTVINVYPSLAKLDTAKPMDMSPDEDDDDDDDEGEDCETGSCVADASNPDPNWVEHNDANDDINGDINGDTNGDLNGDINAETNGDRNGKTNGDKYGDRRKKVPEPKAAPAPQPEEEEHKTRKESKKMKLKSKKKYMKDEVATTPSSETEETKPIFPSSSNADAIYKTRQQKDNKIDHWNKVHNWSSFQDMLQLLRKRKH